MACAGGEGQIGNNCAASKWSVSSPGEAPPGAGVAMGGKIALPRGDASPESGVEVDGPEEWFLVGESWGCSKWEVVARSVRAIVLAATVLAAAAALCVHVVAIGCLLWGSAWAGCCGGCMSGGGTCCEERSSPGSATLIVTAGASAAPSARPLASSIAGAAECVSRRLWPALAGWCRTGKTEESAPPAHCLGVGRRKPGTSSAGPWDQRQWCQNSVGMLTNTSSG